MYPTLYKYVERIQVLMNRFMTDEEYAECFVDFWGIRSRIAHLLIDYGLKPGVRVLDVPSGHGFFAHEISKVIKSGHVCAVGLLNDAETFRQFSKSVEGIENYQDLITYCVADATALPFRSGMFDFVVNFLGLEDINMTKGRAGVAKSLSEFVRVLKPDGITLITVCLEGDEPDQLVAKEIAEYIGSDALFYPEDFYVEELEKLDIEIIGTKWFYTHRKMTATQAREELQFACDETPKIFTKYKVCTGSFDNLWQKYGERIERFGMAYYSRLCVLIGKK